MFHLFYLGEHIQEYSTLESCKAAAKRRAKKQNKAIYCFQYFEGRLPSGFFSGGFANGNPAPKVDLKDF